MLVSIDPVFGDLRKADDDETEDIESAEDVVDDEDDSENAEEAEAEEAEAEDAEDEDKEISESVITADKDLEVELTALKKKFKGNLDSEAYKNRESALKAKYS